MTQILDIALRFAAQGREGKPIGTIFVLGALGQVSPFLRQLILNPFEGHSPESRNIHNPDFLETLREFAAMDGAFVVNHKGNVEFGGTYIDAPATEAKLREGLGARPRRRRRNHRRHASGRGRRIRVFGERDRVSQRASNPRVGKARSNSWPRWLRGCTFPTFQPLSHDCRAHQDGLGRVMTPGLKRQSTASNHRSEQGSESDSGRRIPSPGSPA